MKPASNRAVQRKFREANAECRLSGETEPLRQALLWLLHDSNRPDYVATAFAAVFINNALECGAATVLNKMAEQN